MVEQYYLHKIELKDNCNCCCNFSTGVANIRAVLCMNGLQASEGSEDVTRGIAESLKAAAEEAVWEQAGFVYDSASGLYYDYNSGYYYDSVSTVC